jgi:hypothetical protein
MTIGARFRDKNLLARFVPLSTHQEIEEILKD